MHLDQMKCSGLLLKETFRQHMGWGGGWVTGLPMDLRSEIAPGRLGRPYRIPGIECTSFPGWPCAKSYFCAIALASIQHFRLITLASCCCQTLEVSVSWGFLFCFRGRRCAPEIPCGAREIKLGNHILVFQSISIPHTLGRFLVSLL